MNPASRLGLPLQQMQHQLAVLLSRLSPREQRLVSIFGGLLAVVLVWSAVVSPFLSGRDSLRREIATMQSELGQLDGLAKQIKAVETESSKSGSAAKASADFSVLAFVEKAAGASLRPESISSMVPARRAIDGGRTESTVDLKLSGVSLGEVVALLRAVEDEASPVYIKTFSVKKRYDDASRFDVSLVAAAALPG